MMNPIRLNTPQRTCTKNYRTYRQYKDFLKKDFNDRCGYCDCKDQWIGGKRTFHIDHFAPWKKFEKTHPEIKTLYINLVYSCPYCNGFKSDDWVSDDPYISIIGNKGYIDPCSKDYDASFIRNSQGEIIPLTEVAKYMYEKLGLGLDRHSIIWQIDKLLNLWDEIETHINLSDVSDERKEQLEVQKQKIESHFMPMLKKFHETL